jgi:hypothetical protein
MVVANALTPKSSSDDSNNNAAGNLAAFALLSKNNGLGF